MLRKVFISAISILLIMACSNDNDKSGKFDDGADTVESITVDQSNFDIFVKQLVSDIKNKNLDRLSVTMLYLGGDESRNYNDTYKLDNPSDKKILSATVDVLYDWIVNSDNFSIGITGDMSDQWGEWKVQEIILIDERKVKRKYFSYLRKDGKWYLVKMENENPLEYNPS